MTDKWYLQIQTGMELIGKIDSLDWKQLAEAFCNLPLYEQKQYCKEIWRIGEARAKEIEMQTQEPIAPKSVSERVQEWHQKQLGLK